MKKVLSLLMVVVFAFSVGNTLYARGSSETVEEELVDVRFKLDWVIQGPQAMFLVARDAGYFAEEGLNVTIDPGSGSAGAVSEIAGGAYDIGFADINAMIEFNVANPDEALQAVGIIYNYPPFSIISTGENGVTSPADLVGLRIGAPTFDASYRLWPVFSRAVGLEEDAVEWVAMDPTLREPTLIRGDVDAIGAFAFTALLNLEAAGVDMSDLVTLLYAEHGVDVYGNSVMASKRFIEENPEVVAGIMRALTRAWHDVIADPVAAIESIVAEDALSDPAVELARLQLAIEANMITPEVRENGFGAVDPTRLENAISQVVAAFGLAQTPSVESIFTAEFLPPLAERLPR